MWAYFGVFLGSLAVDLVPIFAPPAWTIMVFFILKFNLNPWIVLGLGVTGTTIGRYFFSLYIPKISRKILKDRKEKELEFVGQKLGAELWKAWIFVFLYALTPLSTTALFTAAGMGKVKPSHTLPPFFFRETGQQWNHDCHWKIHGVERGQYFQEFSEPEIAHHDGAGDNHDRRNSFHRLV
jgi:hypothetical protein